MYFEEWRGSRFDIENCRAGCEPIAGLSQSTLQASSFGRGLDESWADP